MVLLQPIRSGETPVAEPVHRWPSAVMVIVRVRVAGKEPQDHVLIVKIAGFSVFVLSVVYSVNFVRAEILIGQFTGSFTAVLPEDSSELFPT